MNPKQKISLQYHNEISEFLVVLSGSGKGKSSELIYKVFNLYFKYNLRVCNV